MTMQLVSTVTVGSGGAASIEFTSIPQTGTDLMIVASTRMTGSSNYNALGYISINGQQANFSNRYLLGNGATASTSSDNLTPLFFSNGETSTSNTFGNATIYIPNYTSSTNKSISIDAVSENNATNANQAIEAGLWSQTAAITSFSIIRSGFTLDQYSTASLYTITNGSGGATVS